MADFDAKRYRPAPIGTENLVAYLKSELARIAQSLDELADGHYDKSTVAPTKVRDGMVRYADGTKWNPGGGEGLYIYYAAAWHFLG